MRFLKRCMTAGGWLAFLGLGGAILCDRWSDSPPVITLDAVTGAVHRVGPIVKAWPTRVISDHWQAIAIVVLSLGPIRTALGWLTERLEWLLNPPLPKPAVPPPEPAPRKSVCTALYERAVAEVGEDIYSCNAVRAAWGVLIALETCEDWQRMHITAVLILDALAEQRGYLKKSMRTELKNFMAEQRELMRRSSGASDN